MTERTRRLARYPDCLFHPDGVVSKSGRDGNWRDVTPSPRPSGYKWICLDRSNGAKWVRLDELICEAFHGPRPDGLECLQADGDRGNVHHDNLYWGVRPENARDPSIEYRTIDFAPGYEFGSDGSAWSRWATGRHGQTGVWRRVKGLLLDSGHTQVQIKTVDDPNRRFGLHHLICIAFHGPCPEGMECCHNDGVASHNRADNLRWGTPKDNAQDQVLHGVMVRGSRHHKSRFTEEDVQEIRRSHAAGEASYTALSRKYNVSQNAIYRVVKRLVWSHVE